MDPLRGALAGLIGGLAGAYVMERFQSWWQAAETQAAPERRAHARDDGASRERTASNGRAGEPSTVRVAERISEEVFDTPLPEAMKPKAGQLVHYATGAGIGALYGLVGEIVPPVRMANGMPFGAVVWWVADNMAVPAERPGTPPERTAPSTHVYALASHLVYGFTTETVRFLVRFVL
ncbi:MAG TPA: DUF1440 domain-containing protein [Candidatus Limnocylindria bacterium]